ncbi:MAG TPA: hypothetical protein VLH81_00200 [Desulfobacterales bacterium]|nr:hypothetical protein [Desulfobacterales bacterium]
MDSGKQVLDRVRIPTRIIVNRLALTPGALADIVRTGTFTPAGGAVCELEAGGKIIAWGRIVRRRGGYFFKVREVAEEAGS